jgi:hypothetical protein
LLTSQADAAALNSQQPVAMAVCEPSVSSSSLLYKSNSCPSPDRTGSVSSSAHELVLQQHGSSLDGSLASSLTLCSNSSRPVAGNMPGSFTSSSSSRSKHHHHHRHHHHRHQKRQ